MISMAVMLVVRWVGWVWSHLSRCGWGSAIHHLQDQRRQWLHPSLLHRGLLLLWLPWNVWRVGHNQQYLCYYTSSRGSLKLNLDLQKKFKDQIKKAFFFIFLTSYTKKWINNHSTVIACLQCIFSFLLYIFRVRSCYVHEKVNGPLFLEFKF
jgi:hypothetical protein